MTICNTPQACALDSQTTRRSRTLSTNWSVLAVMLMCLASFHCKVTLVPPYDAGVEQQIVNTAKMNDRLYLEMQDEPVADRTYNKYSSKYLDIESEINSILLKNQARRQSHDLIVITNNLKTLFVQFKDKHKQDSTISDADIKLNQLQIAAAWKALLVAERGLKLAGE
ncbi:MAG: hypothetical protein E6H10_17685 [Bacteroidetes bacterium]|nr:MAG: hypothetical protein E6H10_17685 [Bacteroidota bacterium]